MQQGVKQVASGVVARGETRFQLVAESHQFIDLGDDAVLLGQAGGAVADAEPENFESVLGIFRCPVPTMPDLSYSKTPLRR